MARARCELCGRLAANGWTVCLNCGQNAVSQYLHSFCFRCQTDDGQHRADCTAPWKDDYQRIAPPLLASTTT